MFEHELDTAWSHLHWGLTRQRVFTAGHEDEGSESPLEKLVETLSVFMLSWKMYRNGRWCSTD